MDQNLIDPLEAEESMFVQTAHSATSSDGTLTPAGGPVHAVLLRTADSSTPTLPWPGRPGAGRRHGAADLDYPGTRPWPFTGGSIQQLIVDVSGEPYLDLEKEAIGMMKRD